MVYNQNMSDQVKQIIDELVENYQPEKIILFGSRVSGKVHEDSDVDLVVVKKTDKKFRDRIREASAGLKYSLPIDLVVYTPEEFERMAKENSFVREEVIKRGQVVYEQS